MRNVYIDLLRGFSIAAVLLVHKLISPDFLFFLPKNMRSVFEDNGAYGVVLFFAISGYLITSRSLLRWKEPAKIAPDEFYIMRAARILPLLFLFLAFNWLLHSMKLPDFHMDDPHQFTKAVMAALAFRYNNFFLHGGNEHGLYAMAPLWSLSIEETFYFVFPLAFIVLKRPWLIALGLVGLAIEGPMIRNNMNDFYTWRGCADSLAAGCLAALAVDWLKNYRPPKSIAFAAMAIGAGLIFFTFIYAPIRHFYTYGPNIVATGGALFLFGAHFAPPPALFVYRKNILRIILFLPALLGALSYEIYLFFLSFMLLSNAGNWPSGLRSILVLAVLLTGGFLLNRLFTEPINRGLRRHLLGKPSIEAVT